MLNRLIGRTTEGLGGAGRLPPQNIWQRVEDALTAADAALADEEAYVRSGLRDEALANARGIEHERQANIPHRNPQDAQVFHDAEQRARAELTAAYPELPPAEIARRAREAAIDVLANHNGNLRPSTSYDEEGRHRPGTPRDYRDFYRRNHAIVTGRGGGG